MPAALVAPRPSQRQPKWALGCAAAQRPEEATPILEQVKKSLPRSGEPVRKLTHNESNNWKYMGSLWPQRRCPYASTARAISKLWPRPEEAALLQRKSAAGLCTMGKQLSTPRLEGGLGAEPNPPDEKVREHETKANERGRHFVDLELAGHAEQDRRAMLWYCKK